nr:TetR family transcriptional regulator [uncultured Albidiferax sp.]
MSAHKDSKPGKTQIGSASHRRDRKSTLENLERALLRVQEQGKKLSILAVANEAGVSNGLIHNTYPDFAGKVRTQMGRGIRQKLDAKFAELDDVRASLKAMRAERDTALADVKTLASINETLRQEVTTLRAATSGKVTVLTPRTSF